MRNYYDILNIEKNASQETIKKAYKISALKFHPDKNKESTAHEKFIEINQAYEVLKNEETRKKYDIEINLDYNTVFTSKNTNDDSTSDYNFRDKDLNRQQEEARKKAEQYANMSFDEFSNISETIINAGKEVKRKVKSSSRLGCGCLSFILAFLAFLQIIMSLIGSEDIHSYPMQIVIIIFLLFLGNTLTKKD